MIEINEEAFEALCKKHNLFPKTGSANSDYNPISRNLYRHIIEGYELEKQRNKESND